MLPGSASIHMSNLGLILPKVSLAVTATCVRPCVRDTPKAMASILPHRHSKIMNVVVFDH